MATVEAFGHMAHLMSKEKLEEYIQRLLQGITSLYRRHSEHYVITQVSEFSCTFHLEKLIRFQCKIMKITLFLICLISKAKSENLVLNYSVPCYREK